jgi:hypothetical protein
MNSIASRATWTSRLGVVVAAVVDVEASSRGDSSRAMSDCDCECECDIAISDGSDGDAGGDGVWGMACFVFGVTGVCLALGAGVGAAGI